MLMTSVERNNSWMIHRLEKKKKFCFAFVTLLEQQRYSCSTEDMTVIVEHTEQTLLYNINAQALLSFRTLSFSKDAIKLALKPEK